MRVGREHVQRYAMPARGHAQSLRSVNGRRISRVLGSFDGED